MRIGTVTLRVGDLDRTEGFYRDVIGLDALDSTTDRRVDLAAPGSQGSLIRLIEDRDAVPRPHRTTGLFHLAILLPTRQQLAIALDRVIQAGWRLLGASDHLVSEAIYLSDPEGNGIEIYRDRPPEEWRRTASGELEMATLPLELEALLAEADRSDASHAPPATTTIGHVHLNVSDLASSEHFYADALGFDTTVRGYPGALFFGANGYHHHIGCNIWAGSNAPPPPPRSLGLVEFEVVLPDRQSLDAVADRLDRLHPSYGGSGETGIEVSDPARNGVSLIC